MTDIRSRIKGSIPALITPLKDGKVDEAAFRKLVNWQIAEGSSGLVPVGTTGESPTLSHEEQMRVIEICVEEAAGRLALLAGACLVLLAQLAQQVLLRVHADGAAVVLRGAQRRMAVDHVQELQRRPHLPRRPGRRVRDRLREARAVHAGQDFPFVVHRGPSQ